MTALISVADGNASNSATWSPAQVPVSGDTLTVQHNITFDVNMTVGHSPPASDAVAAIKGDVTGSVTIAANVELICRGDFLMDRCPVTMQAGSTLSLDPTQAADPDNAVYLIQFGTVLRDDVRNRLTVNGTETNQCALRTINTLPSHAYAYVRRQAEGGNQLDATWLNCKRLNRTPNNWFWETGLSSNDNLLRWINGTADDCGMIINIFSANDQTIDLQNIRFTNVVGGQALNLNFGVSNTTGVRRVQGCMIDAEVDLSTGMDCLYRDNVQNGRLRAIGGIANDTLTIEDNYFMVYGSPTRAQSMKGNVVFFVTEATSGSAIQPITADLALNFDENVFQLVSAQTDPDLDFIVVSDTTNPRTWNVRNNVVLPSTNGNRSGTLITQGTAAVNVRVVADHNTCYNGAINNRRGIKVGKVVGAGGNDILEAKNNIFFGFAQQGIKVGNASATGTDLVLSSALHHNGGHNQAAGSNGNGYDNFTFSSGTPGANDVNEDPQMANAGHGVLEFDTANGGNGTWANFLTEIMKLNLSDYNSAYSVTSFKQFVVATSVPTNENYRGAADDGQDLGAIPMAAPPTPSTGNIPLIGGRNPLIS